MMLSILPSGYSIRRNWILMVVATWILFALMGFMRIFDIFPFASSTVPELKDVSTVLIGESGSYLQVHREELDCVRLNETNSVSCRSQIGDMSFNIHLSRHFPVQYLEYSATCKSMSSSEPVLCWPLSSSSPNVLPVVINGRLGISDERWDELYEERGFWLPHFDLVGWVPLGAICVTLLSAVGIWRQGFEKHTVMNNKTVSILSDHVGMVIVILAVVFFTSFPSLAFVAWEIEDFITRIYLR